MDYKKVLVTSRCSRCARPVSAPIGELRGTGMFACICGTVTHAAYRAPEDRVVGRRETWR